MAENQAYDVVVVGAGNAALCAALAAQEQGARVLVLEKAPQHLRGGNSYFTGGGFRFAYNGVEDYDAIIPDLTETERATIDVGSYPTSKFYDDLMRVTEGLADPDLADLLVNQSYPTMVWMRERGMRWVLMFGRQSFKVGDKYRFWGGLLVEAVGGGKGLIDRLFEIIEKEPTIDVRYDTKASDLLTDEAGRVTGVRIKDLNGYADIPAGAVVLACGGFEANTEMRTRYLGPGWDLAKVRGTPYNTGDGINMALRIGAEPHGHWSGCHAVAWDANAPSRGGDWIITDLFQKHSYPFGLIVNVDGERFVDEGADFRNYTYAKYGRELLRQPQRLGFQIFDAKVEHLLRDEYKIREVTSATTNTIEELASELGINRENFVRTIREFNAAVQEGEFNPTILDGKHTEGITPPKTNWALPIDTPPFKGYA
ncbi:MAG TPA: FAD-dependent tricarballylate dehydrogenase TcuA, partial [Dehalococcoidia bacterium]|nr:FAD-dependent tricarballylate dehydrogenase TcuA [Dehalococcoidia bacterium]